MRRAGTALPPVMAMLIMAMLMAPAPARALTIKLATLAPEGSPWYDIIRDMAEEWKDISGGEVTVRIYPGGVAGDEADVVRKMRVGQLHAAVLAGEGLSNISPDIHAVHVPLMLASYAELDHVMATMGPRFAKQFAEKGFRSLNWCDAGWVRLFATRPVTRPKHRKKLRLFTWAGNPAFVEAWKGAGFRPVPLQVTELHTALASGLVDSFATTPVAALSFQWFGIASHMMDMTWSPLLAGTVITERAWNRIPERFRVPLSESAARAGARLRAETRRLDGEAIAAMRQYGLTVHPVSDKMRPRWEKIARGAYPYIVGPVVKPAVAAEVERLRDAFRSRKAAPRSPESDRKANREKLDTP